MALAHDKRYVEMFIYILFFPKLVFFFKWTNKQMNLFNAGSEDWFHQTYSLATQQTNLFRI